MTFLIIILIGILSSAVSFISSSGSIVNPSESGIKHIAKRGWLFIISSSVLVFLPVVQNYISDRESDKKEVIAKLEQDRRDRILRRSYDSSTNAIILNMSEALAKYGLKYDSAKRSIEKLVKDSAKRNITIIEENDPSITICDINSEKSNNGTVHFKFQVCYDHSPHNVILDCEPIIVENGKFKSLGTIKKLIIISKVYGEGFQLGFPMFIKETFNQPITNRVFFYIKGTYTNRRNTKQFPFEYIYSYDIYKEEFGVTPNKIEADILEYLKTAK